MELPPQTRYVDRDGKALAYQAFGAGPVALVVAAEICSHLELIWTDPGYAALLKQVASFARLALFERMGLGLSDPLDRVRPLEDQADDIVAVIDAASMEQAIVWGINTTAPAAVMAAARHPERVSGLVLIAPMMAGWRGTPAGELVGWTPAEAARWDELFENAIARWGHGLTLGMFAPALVSARNVRVWGLLERSSASPAVFRALWDAAARVDVRSVLPLVRCPTVVARHADNPAPAAVHRLAVDAIPGARWVELPAPSAADGFDDYWRPYLDLSLELAGVDAAAPSVGRRLAAVAFTDIVGSTEHAASLGDAEWRAILERHDTLAAQLVSAAGGRVVKSLGDGTMSVFDGPAQAISATQRLIEEVRPLGIELRAGIHAGECEVRGDDLAGMAVHIAARVAGTAGPGELLVSRTVRDLVVGSGISFVARGSHTLRGVPEAWELFAVSPEDSGPIAIADQPSPLRATDRLILAGARRAPGAMRRLNGLIQRRRQFESP